jgi:hypothetical protein
MTSLVFTQLYKGGDDDVTYWQKGFTHGQRGVHTRQKRFTHGQREVHTWAKRGLHTCIKLFMVTSHMGRKEFTWAK